MKHVPFYRYIAAMLALLMLLSCAALVSCAEDVSDDPQDIQDPTQDPSGAEEEEKEEPRVMPDVPDGMYDYTVKIMHWLINGHDFIWEETCPDEDIASYTGDLIADDIFDRTAWMEENYGIVIEKGYQEHVAMPTAVANMISSGSDDYQMQIEFGFGAQRAFGKNYYLDLSTLDYIDFEKPWWVDSVVNELRIGDYVEFALSDMLLLDKASTSLMFYNIRMATDLGITGLYEDVENKEWTIERLAEYAELALADDGDGEWTQTDTYGIIGGDDPTHNFYIGAGKHFLTKDANGEYYYEYGSDEDTIEIMTVILEDLMYQDFYWNTWAHRNDDTSLLGFDTGSSLFLASVARECNGLRQMEDAYGILPNPLYDEYQDQYYSQINNYRDSILSVFSTAGDPNKVAAAIELMSYYSYYEIYPDFYEVVIQGRGTRDAESREMLDIIFSNRTYDLTFVFDPFGLSDEILRFPANQNSNLASFLAARESKMESALEQLVELRDQYN